MNKIVIPLNAMPTLNQHDKANRGNRFGGAKLKKRATSVCTVHILKAINQGLTIDTKDMPADFRFYWYWKNRQTDKDNIAFIRKYIFDGMIQAKLITNDGWYEIGNWVDTFKVDKNEPRVEIEILEGGTIQDESKSQETKKSVK